MVNCKKCGAPLSLDQVKCPYCGEVNEEAREHLEKLAKLDKDYKKTKQEVMTEVKKTKKGYNLLVILVMLLIANMLMIPVWGASYDIAEKIAVSNQPISEVKEELSRLLEDRDYPAFVACYDRNEINYNEDFEDDYVSLTRWEDDPFVLKYINEIREEYELFLKTFLHLTDEDVTGLAGMNSSAIVVLVNERLNNEE